MSLFVLFLTLCSMAVAQGSCPTSIEAGSAVSLNIQCYRGEAKVTWRSNDEADIVNLEYNCNPLNGANSQVNHKTTLLDWSEFTSGEKNITTRVLADNAYKCSVSGCYEDNLFFDRFQIPEQTCTFSPELLIPTSVIATPSSTSPPPSPSLSDSLLPSLSSSPSFVSSSVVLSQLQTPTPIPTTDTICCSCNATTQMIRAKPTNASFSRPDTLQIFTDNGIVFICILAVLVLVILLQFIVICVLYSQVKRLKKATKGPISI